MENPWFQKKRSYKITKYNKKSHNKNKVIKVEIKWCMSDTECEEELLVRDCNK
jgi:hypothetical protein